MQKSRKQQAKFWQGHVYRQRESGLSIAKYCRQQGLALSSFSYWRAKAKNFSSQTTGTFTKIRLPKVQEPALRFDVEIELASGIRLRSSVWPPASVLRAYAEFNK